MKLQEALRVPRGVVSVVGSGGKSTLLRELARELADDGETVALATTTRILPFEGVRTLAGEDAGQVARAIAGEHVVCVASPAEKGKLAAPSLELARLAEAADHVLVEADGSKRLPLKAHAAWEPVVPPESVRTILAVGAGGFCRPVSEAAHRPEIFCRLAGCTPDDAATPELVARVIAAEGLADQVVVNQAEEPAALAAARQLAALLDVPVFAGSIRNHDLKAL